MHNFHKGRNVENKILENIYPEQRLKIDRRQNNISVAIERRSGAERRNSFENLIQQNNCNKVDVYASFRTQQPICVSPLSIVQPVDKVEEIQDCIKDKNYLKAFGAGLLLLNTLDKEIQEFNQFKKDLFAIITGKKKIQREDYQIPHSFTANTVIDNIRSLKFLKKFDKTLFDFKLCIFILNKVGMIDWEERSTGLYDKAGEPIYKIKIVGNEFMEILGRAFLRTPILSIGVLGLLESPNIFKEKKQRKKQIIKSTINVVSVTTGGSLLGAIGAYYPPFGFIGAGLGSYVGYRFSEYINKSIDKKIKN